MLAKSKRRVVPALLLVAGLIVGFGALSFFQSNKRDKVISGKRLSEHLILAFSATASPNVDEVARESRSIFLDHGTNSFPLLEDWLRVKTPRWKVDAGRWLWGKGWQIKQLPPEEFELIACRAIASLQADGLPLAMSLAEASTNANAKLSTLAATVLLNQTQRWPHLFFENEKEALIEGLEKAISDLNLQPSGGTNRVSERIALLQTAYRCLSRPASAKHLVFSLLYSGYNPRARLRALQILSRRGEGLEAVQSLLVDGLSSSDPMLAENAAICIGSFGARASNMLGQLEKALEHPDGNVRREASNAIVRIKVEGSVL